MTSVSGKPDKSGDGLRLRRGLLANALSLILRIATQLGLLPLLFLFWSEAMIGRWLMLFSLPMIFQTVSTVFFAAASNHVLSEKSDPAVFRPIFRSSIVLAATATLLLLLLAVASILALPFAGIVIDWSPEMLTALGIFAGYVVATLPLSAMEVPLRNAGRYPDHVVLQATATAAEAIAIAVCVVLGGAIVEAALAMLGARIAFSVIAWLFARPARSMRSEAGSSSVGQSWRAIVPPALGFMALPAVHALNLSGYTLLIGFAFSPIVLAGFVATRTIVRLLDLATNFLFASQYYEAAHFAGSPIDRSDLLRRLFATTTSITIIAASGFAALLWLTGPMLQDWLTSGKTEFDRPVAMMLCLAASLRLLSASPTALLSAVNRHVAFASIYLAFSITAFLIAVALAFGGASLFTVCVLLVVAELGQFVPALLSATKAANTSPGAFVASLFSGQRFGDMQLFIKGLKRRKT
ncbi:hypothetical protein GRI38_13235 [Altererythrobacter aurantiacus]|uniref:Membrane protein involved in the export of O-antigen and teichoic acid n=1 Tax=Parapontixanthobacter aurantiacus TaxID=1463599 RepID=A0A844ZEP0_9SPHN|nr:hypothetical protein [Parapontixanthobacter aurantiacus]MXO86991.1 hypothetical protein [Parapontixanthobacter aurantiacus]